MDAVILVLTYVYTGHQAQYILPDNLYDVWQEY